MKTGSPTAIVPMLICLALAGCGQRMQPLPQDLVEAVAAEASLMPQGHITNLDGTEPRYVIVVQMLNPSRPGTDKWTSTNAVMEWAHAPGYGTNGTAWIGKLRKRGSLEKASYRARFVVDAWTASNAVTSVELSYPERGGNTREWTFANSTGQWARVKDVNKGWWD